jgi:hypothetical protein
MNFLRLGLGGAVCALVIGAGGSARAADDLVLRVESGRLTGVVGAADAGVALRPNVTYEVTGSREVRVVGPRSTRLRVLPGTQFDVMGVDAQRVALRVRTGVVADATSDGLLDLATPAGVLRGDRAVLFARVATRNVYVEHQQGSSGTAGLFASGSAVTPLGAGTFRMMALDAGDPLPRATVPLRADAAPAPAVSRASVAAGTPSPAPARATAFADPAATALPYDPSCGPNPCADPAPCPPAPVMAPCAPPPCAPPPVCGGCGEMVRHSGVPVPVRRDDAGRSPLGSALGADACNPERVCACECGRIPYVHYVEGLECDVSTYRVGNALVTIRPASRVRVHRLPDGALQCWAPNIGRDLALIEVNDNQFGYIGDDGFIVIGCTGQIQYFRGLVHLYSHPDRPYRDTNPPRDREISEDQVLNELPAAGGKR